MVMAQKIPRPKAFNLTMPAYEGDLFEKSTLFWWYNQFSITVEHNEFIVDLFIFLPGSIERIIGFYLLVRLSFRNKTVFAKTYWAVVGCHSRTIYHHDCNGLLRKCSPYITHEFHIPWNLYMRSIVYAWHIDFNCSTKHCYVSGWCNSCFVSGIDFICATNEIRFHRLQWRTVRCHDSIHDIRYCNDILEWANHSPCLRLHRCTPLQYLLDIRVSIWLNEMQAK